MYSVRGGNKTFLATSDEINYNTNRYIVEVRDSQNNFKGKSRILIELQVYDQSFTDPSSKINIGSSTTSSSYGDVFDASNDTMRFRLIVYRPILIGTKQYIDHGHQNKTKVKGVTVAERTVNNYLENMYLIQNAIKNGKRSCELKDFLKFYAHGRIYTDEKGGSKAESYEVVLSEYCNDNQISKMIESNDTTEGYEIISKFMKKISLLHRDGIILGSPTLKCIKMKDKEYVWGTASFKMMQLPSRDLKTPLPIKILMCVDVFNFLFNNEFVLSRLGISDISRLNFSKIRKWAEDPLRIIIPFSGEFLRRVYEKDSDQSFLIFIQEEISKLNGQEKEEAISFLQNVEKFNWENFNTFFENHISIRNSLLFMISSHNDESVQSRQPVPTAPSSEVEGLIREFNLRYVKFNGYNMYTQDDKRLLYGFRDRDVMFYTIEDEELVPHEFKKDKNYTLHTEDSRLLTTLSNEVIFFQFENQKMKVYYKRKSSNDVEVPIAEFSFNFTTGELDQKFKQNITLITTTSKIPISNSRNVPVASVEERVGIPHAPIAAHDVIKLTYDGKNVISDFDQKSLLMYVMENGENPTCVLGTIVNGKGFVRSNRPPNQERKLYSMQENGSDLNEHSFRLPNSSDTQEALFYIDGCYMIVGYHDPQNGLFIKRKVFDIKYNPPMPVSETPIHQAVAIQDQHIQPQISNPENVIQPAVPIPSQFTETQNHVVFTQPQLTNTTTMLPNSSTFQPQSFFAVTVPRSQTALVQPPVANQGRLVYTQQAIPPQQAMRMYTYHPTNTNQIPTSHQIYSVPGIIPINNNNNIPIYPQNTGISRYR